MPNDILLQQDVVAALDHAEGVVPGTIGVEVHHGVVKLAGRVSADRIRGRAEAAVRNVAGVAVVLMDVDVADAGASR